MSYYKSIFLALRGKDMEELLNEVAAFNRIFYKVKTRVTPDEEYKLLIVENIDAYPNMGFFDIIETFIESRRHAYVLIGEDNAWDSDVLTFDDEGTDEEFEDVLPVNVRVEVDEYFHDDNPFYLKFPGKRGVCCG